MTLPKTTSTLALCGLLCLAGCITDPVTGKSVMGMPTSDAEEISMGKSYRPVIVQQFSGAYPDAELQSYMGSIVLGMAHSSVRPELPWTFTIVNSSEPNAFAVPGGEVYMTRGLLWRLDDEAEFAVVMGHEIGHVEHRHTVQSMGRDTLIGAVGQLGGEAIGVPEIGGMVSTLVISRYSRDQERESDERGVFNSYHAGYDPRQGADVFRKFLQMKQQAGGGESVIDAWTSSHPLDSERIATIGVLSAEIDPRLEGDRPVPGLVVQTGRFAELIAKLRGEERVYDRHDAALAKIAQQGSSKESIRAAIPEFEACASALPGHAFFANTAGKACLVAGDTARARTWLERASSLNQGLLEPELGLGMLALEAKRYDETVDRAQRGLALLPDNYMSLYLRGEGYLGLGRTDEAKKDFQAVVESAPADSQQSKAAAAHLGAPAKTAPAKKSKR